MISTFFLFFFVFFFFTDPSPTEIYTLSLHDALPICGTMTWRVLPAFDDLPSENTGLEATAIQIQCQVFRHRSEEHTSELQSRPHLVCRLLLEKKKKLIIIILLPFS